MEVRLSSIKAGSSSDSVMNLDIDNQLHSESSYPDSDENAADYANQTTESRLTLSHLSRQSTRINRNRYNETNSTGPNLIQATSFTNTDLRGTNDVH